MTGDGAVLPRGRLRPPRHAHLRRLHRPVRPPYPQPPLPSLPNQDLDCRYFGRALFTFLQLLVSYFGGRTAMARRLRGTPLHITTLPICCVLKPCLQPLKPTRFLFPRVVAWTGRTPAIFPRENLRRVCALVAQLGIVRPLILFAKGTMWADQVPPTSRLTPWRPRHLDTLKMGGASSELNTLSTPALLGISVVSTVTGMWGLMILVRLIDGVLPAHRLAAHIRLAQLVIVLLTFQVRP